MPWTSLKISPGLVRNTTRYATSGTWFDCSMVRFRDGFPEKWAGWENAYSGFTMVGKCRSLHRHSDLGGFSWLSAGTSQRFYMISDDLRYDVTPWAGPAVALPNNPFSVTATSSAVIVHHPAHGHFIGDVVLFSGVTGTIGGLPASDFNKAFIISGTAPDGDNHYEINLSTDTPASTATGGGAAVTARYLLRAGNDDFVSGGGWGANTWGYEEWGGDHDNATGEPLFAALDQLGIWSQDNWGEDLVACAASNGIYYWKASTPTARMINIKDIPADYLGPGAPGDDGNAPAEAQFIIVSHRDRHLLAFGASRYGDAVVEPMTFRWCDQETITNWNEADLAGTAGSLPLSNGSKFIAAIATPREILVWTDQALYSVQYIGAPLIYQAELLDRWSDIAGMKAVCSFNGVIYWMGRGGFYAYSGRTEKIPCPVWDYVVNRMNKDQFPKVYASSNQLHNEVIWFYPSILDIENDSYVAFNVMEQTWTFGSLERTAWLDLDALRGVVAASPDGRIYAHEVGADDGSQSPVRPIEAYIESGPIELSSEGSYDKGDKMMFVRRVMPDVTFREMETSSDSPQMNITLKMMDRPGGGFRTQEASETRRSVAAGGQSVVIQVEQFTEQAWVRLRGRSMTLRLESDTVGTNWRAGVIRIDARTDGAR
jgi:hypothetical protein